MGGLSFREELIVVLVGGVIALLPRRWVSVRIKRWLLAAWVLFGILQIVDGYRTPIWVKNGPYPQSYPGLWPEFYGTADVLIFGAGFLMLTETRWKRVVGVLVILLGLFVLSVAGTMYID